MSKLQTVKLGAIAENFDNKRVPLSSAQRSGLKKVYPYYGAQGIIDRVDDYLFDGEYLLVAEDGENLKSQKQDICQIVTGKFWVNNHAHIIRAKSPHSTHYLNYLLNLLDLRPYITGSAQPKLTKENLQNIVLPIHPPANQQRIAAVLSTLDAKIELNQRLNAELEGMAKLLYDYWFVQYDFPISPAQAKALGKPSLAGKPYRSSGGPMVFHPQLKREIPKGWAVSSIGETFNTHLGGTPSRKEPTYWNPGEIAWLSSGEKEQLFVSAPDETISRKGLANSAATLLPAGTVILSIVRHIRASILAIEAATNQSVLGIRETATIKHCFIYPFIMGEIPRYMILRTGAQQPHINKGTVDETPLVIPSEEILKAYTTIAAPIFEQIRTLHQQSHHLAQLRDWLLPMLMNGQVTVGKS